MKPLLGIKKIYKQVNMKKISVIIPVYNVEKYLKQCLDSVLCQTYKNLEILLVDDGSTDNSGSICDDIAKMDSRIKVIHKENGGLSSARNAGLDLAIGDYIAFVDSDDYLDLSTFENCIAKLLETDADVCMFSHFTTDGQYEKAHKLPLDKEIYQREELKTNIVPLFIGQKNGNEEPLLGFVCRQIFKRNAIGELRFRSERDYYAEDVVFDLEFYTKANKMCVINKPLYYYRYVETSLSNRYREGLFEKLLRLIAFKQEIIEKHKITDCEERINRSIFRAARGGIINVKRASSLSKKTKKQEIKKIVNNLLVRKSIKKIKLKGIKEKIFAILLKLRLSSILLAII